MKHVSSTITVLIAFYATPAAAEIYYDSVSQILTDTTDSRMWLLHGVGFASSYPYPDFAVAWIATLNTVEYGGYSDWRLPTVAVSQTEPADRSGELGQLFLDLSGAFPERTQWPMGLGTFDYGGSIIFTDTMVGPGLFWGLRFGDGHYMPIYIGNAYPYVGVMAVRQILLPSSADFDEDGDVDSADLVQWQASYSIGTLHSEGDADLDGDVDGRDFLIWQRQYTGVGMPTINASVPEPTALALACVATLLVWCSEIALRRFDRGLRNNLE